MGIICLMKLISKFLLVLLFTIFATIECSNSNSNIHKMFSQLNTGEINKGDIIKYYKTNYDPMLELHNNFFDKCIDHLVDQEHKKNNSFFMNIVEKVKDIFSQGTTYDKLYFGELGITVECDNYINKTVSEGFISKKKEELKKLRSSLVSINQGNVVRPMGRLRSESGNGDAVNDKLKTTLRTAGYTQSQIDNVMSQMNSGNVVSTPATAKGGNSASGKSGASASGLSASGKGSSAGGSISSSSSGSSVKVSGNSSTTNSSTTKISGGSSSSSVTQTVTYDANGKKIVVGGSNGTEKYDVKDKNYSGSTTSGMGAKFSIFYDRKITTKEGKSYVEIGGVAHLIESDGWIHGLNIDSSDKNINYNIAYENYFDTSCESMLEFMKNKYTQLLADYNMNKDYVHNLQIMNRRYITKFDTCTKESTQINLRLNTCEQRIQDERVKKSTLYHNIKDIKTIKVDTRVKDLEITINKLEITINNYKIEITNLRQIIIVNKKQCETDKKDCHKKGDEKCKIEINTTINNCSKEKEALNLIINNLRITITTLEVNWRKCKNQIEFCEKNEIYKKLQKCEKNYFDLTKKSIECSSRIIIIQRQYNECTLKHKSLEVNINILNINIKKCKLELEACTKDGGKVECDKRISIINQTTIINIRQWTQKYEKCEKDNYDCNDNRKNYLICNQKLLVIRNELNIQCDKDKLEIKNKCEDEKAEKQKQIQIKITLIKKYEMESETCSNDLIQCKNETKQLQINITKITIDLGEKCDKRIAEKGDEFTININIEINKWKQCQKQREQQENDEKKNCDESKTIIINTNTKVTKDLETCNADKVLINQELVQINLTLQQTIIKLSNCTSSKPTLTDYMKECQKIERKNCQTYYHDLKISLSTCLEQKSRIEQDFKALTINLTEINIKFNTCEGKLVKKDNECQQKISVTIINIRKEENKSCDESKVEINIQIKKIITNYENCEASRKICDKDFDEYKGFKQYYAMYFKCKNNLEDREKSIVTFEGQINVLQVNIKNVTTNYNTCTKNLGACQLSISSSTLTIELNTCNAKLTNVERLVRRMDLFILKLQSSFQITMNQIMASHNQQIIKLTTIITDLREKTSTSTTTTQTITVTITNNNTDIQRNQREIDSLKDRIKQLIEQKKEILMKIDTIDCTSITLISEYKNKISEYQHSIQQYYNQILTLTQYILVSTGENSKLEAQIEFYKSNSEYYQELINKYSEINTDQSEYIKQLKEMIKKYIITDEDGSVIDPGPWFQKNDGDKIITQLKLQITQINITVTKMVVEYTNNIKQIKIDYGKSISDCKNQLNIYINTISENEEKCIIRIDRMKRKLIEAHNSQIISLKFEYNQAINDCKKNCKGGSPTDCDNTYNFEVYMKHCHILIEKNTANDCKTIGDIRTYYNEKCIMTALPGSTKDLTTFASSDFSDDRNALMMKRLNSSK